MKKFAMIFSLLTLFTAGTAFAPNTDKHAHLMVTFEDSEGEEVVIGLDQTSLSDWQQKLIKAEFYQAGEKKELTCTLVWSPMDGDAEMILAKDEASILRTLEKYQPILQKGDRIIVDNIANKANSMRYAPIVLSLK